MSNEMMVYAETYKGQHIEIFYDLYHSNPFEEGWEDLPLIAVYTGVNKIYEYPEGVLVPPILTPKQIVENVDEIKALLLRNGYDKLDWDSTAWDNYDEINNVLETLAANQVTIDDVFSTLSTIYGFANRLSMTQTIHGSVQGEWAIVFAVQSEDAIPCTYTTKRLQDAIDTYRDWAFGNIYGYMIFPVGPRLSVDDVEESCWGFFGNYNSGPGSALYEAKAAINAVRPETCEFYEDRDKGVRSCQNLTVQLQIDTDDLELATKFVNETCKTLPSIIKWDIVTQPMTKGETK